MLTIDFLRHGELEGGIKYRGCMDDALTIQGRESMDKVWCAVADKVTQIISSPLRRCAVPAKDWAKQAGLVCQMDRRLQELAYGDWEGLTPADIEREYPRLFAAWRKDPTHLTPPHGESMHDFSRRVFSFMDELLSTHSDEHVLLVTHSGTMRLMLAYMLGAPIKSTRHLMMPYACWSRAQVEDGHARLVFHHRLTG